MATKSFVTEFKLSSKSGNKLADAIESSKRVNHTINKMTKDVTDQNELRLIMNSFLREK